MAEGAGSLADVDDIDGTFDKSEFLYYVGTKLHMSVRASYKKFLVFWDEEDDESDSHQSLFSSLDPSPHPPPSICSSMVKDRIKTALLHVDLSYSLCILAQFWTPVIIGGQLLLKTSDQPFGLTNLKKGLCSYRKLCLSYYYCCNNAPDEDMIGVDKRESVLLTGPPSRVFLNGLPEYSPNLEFYSKTEYPLRDEAMCRKIKNYMAVPVFESSSLQCIGVLELVSTAGLVGEMDMPAYIFGLISTALQGVELRTSNFTCHFEMEKDLATSSTGVSHALRDIRKALDEACTKHQLLFAQTWIRRSGKNQNYLNNVLSTTSDEYYQSQTRFSILRYTCESFQLLRGRGVVWSAFSSGNSCFCIDVTQLSIAEYSFAHVARKVRLDSSFAICLKSDHTGDDDFYVLELFLPSMTAYPRSLLELVLLSMKKHLNSFRIASGQRLGNEMHVEVLRTSEDNKLDFFRLFPSTTGSSVGLQALQDQNSLMYLPFSNEQTDDLLECGATENANVNMAHYPLESYNFDCLIRDYLDYHVSSNTRSMKEGNSYNNSFASTCRFPDQDYLERLQADPKKGRNPAPKLNRFTLKDVEKYFGLKLEDAARCLEVSSSTLKRKCRELGITSWPRKKNQTTCSTTSIESNQCAAKGDVILYPNISAEEGTTCSNQHFSQATTMPSSSFISAEEVTTCSNQPFSQAMTMPNNSFISAEEGTACSNQHFSQAITIPSSSFMTIKAAYGEKIKIKFRLPFSSRIIDMETEVASRLKLCVGDFKIWYQDEDDEWILLTCDADLRIMESIRKNTIRVSITRTDTPTF